MKADAALALTGGVCRTVVFGRPGIWAILKTNFLLGHVGDSELKMRAC